jgi:hypothetical protein
MTYLDLARRGRRRKDHDRRLVGSLLLALAVCLAGLSFHIRPATADDGSLETQKGGLFHRKGFIFPEIHRRKELPKPPASTATATQPPKRVASRKPAPRPRSQGATRSAAKATPRARTRRLPRSVVQHAKRNVTRSAKPPELPAKATSGQPVEAEPEQPAEEIPELPVKVASLTSTVPSSSQTTTPEDAVTGGSPPVPPVNWVASSRCLAARLRATINYVARNYGSVRVNSTCRSRRHNRRVGGAGRSYHIGGRAADIRIFGNIRAAARYLRRVVGGYKHYGGGRFHIDTGPKRSW